MAAYHVGTMALAFFLCFESVTFRQEVGELIDATCQPYSLKYWAFFYLTY